jgi:hypothetical protein
MVITRLTSEDLPLALIAMGVFLLAKALDRSETNSNPNFRMVSATNRSKYKRRFSTFRRATTKIACAFGDATAAISEQERKRSVK